MTVDDLKNSVDTEIYVAKVTTLATVLVALSCLFLAYYILRPSYIVGVVLIALPFVAVTALLIFHAKSLKRIFDGFSVLYLALKLQKEENNKRQTELQEEKTDIQNKADELQLEKNRLEQVLSQEHPLCDIPCLYNMGFDYVVNGLKEYCKQEGYTGGMDELEKFRDSYKKMQKENLLYNFRFRFIEMVFPDIYADMKKEEELSKLYDSIMPRRNSIKYWLRGVDYKHLDEIGQEQAAVDAYLANKNKTLWELGTDYELYIGEGCRSNGFTVDYNGIRQGYNDMGIDIIAKRGIETYIIQCKYWREGYYISEKYIMQLYGSSMYYKFHHPSEKVKPLFYSTVRFTDKANKVAKELGVEVKVKLLPFDKRYPSIKCNVNSKGEKIYHLPFERDITRTKIYKDGEFYATTVQEARDKGFRRAYKNGITWAASNEVKDK